VRIDLTSQNSADRYMNRTGRGSPVDAMNRTGDVARCLRARTMRVGRRSSRLTSPGNRLILPVFARPRHGNGVAVTAQSMTGREQRWARRGSGDASAQRAGITMAQKTVQFIIGQILTDEELRARFLDRPAETLSSLRDMGFELTNPEIDALTRTDRRLWTSGAEWIDPRLQRCDLRSPASGSGQSKSCL
jgi:hypothetical protein